MKKKQTHCDWCGTNKRGLRYCPRKTCEIEKQWHEATLKAIEETKHGNKG